MFVISLLSMQRSLALAFQFLTIFRTKVEPPGDLVEVGRSAWAFPVVGYLLGLVLVAAHLVLSAHLPASVAGILVVTLWVVLTGGLHLDGWTDCGDALPTAVPLERRREILKDSRLGSFGALALIILLALKFATVSHEGLPLLCLVAAPAVGRGIMVAGSYGARHSGQGMAASFLSGVDRDVAVRAALLGGLPALLLGLSGILAAVIAFLVAVGFRRLAQSRVEVVNGDVIGAMCELSETVFLVAVLVRW